MPPVSTSLEREAATAGKTSSEQEGAVKLTGSKAAVIGQPRSRHRQREELLCRVLPTRHFCVPMAPWERSPRHGLVSLETGKRSNWLAPRDVIKTPTALRRETLELVGAAGRHKDADRIEELCVGGERRTEDGDTPGQQETTENGTKGHTERENEATNEGTAFFCFLTGTSLEPL
ncbi:hypothetical protein NDU88_001666 [Pleurodeles waltl]|uniref:Uncharacterized protein n=1 Tax=Pleurodeles waltl TaxID=8319 RepID=A0AAV7WJ06_PLEWA|nr:hypothetical protein NDU88_001666 [Pleurodeles waltl]